MDTDARPRVHGPAEALAVIRASKIDTSSDRLVVIVLDAEQKPVLVIDAEGSATRRGIASFRRVLHEALSRRAGSILLATCRRGPSTLPHADDLRAWVSLREGLPVEGIEVADWLIVSGNRWRSLRDVAYEPPA